ncbi:MAG: SDR family NAD(P)-dependent oxidoreductase [Marinilabiliales bacterium]|nr:MAG: SDR family NAD(P)-dependent oxidoreductase [Marinilabiliales bacterium]
MDKEIVLITGATAGIGEATALLLAENGYRLIITGRREERLKELKVRLGKLTDVHTLCFDIRNRSEVENAIDHLPSRWEDIGVLVNNAGLAAGMDYFHEADSDDWEQMIDTNLKGLLYMTRKVAPGMIARGSGQIVNVGSIAGREMYERGNVYSATKHAVEALSRGMRIDMLKHGIKVSTVSPGLVETEFSLVRFKGDSERAKQPYMGMKPLTGRDVAEAVLFMINRPPHVSIHDLLIMPAAQAAAMTVHRD